MCVKRDVLKQMFLVVKTPLQSSHPLIPVGVVKAYPLYSQIFEDTKHRGYLNATQVQALGFEAKPDMEYKMVRLDVPRSYLI